MLKQFKGQISYKNIWGGVSWNLSPNYVQILQTLKEKLLYWSPCNTCTRNFSLFLSYFWANSPSSCGNSRREVGLSPPLCKIDKHGHPWYCNFTKQSWKRTVPHRSTQLSLIFIVALGTVSQLLLGVHPVVNQVLLIICHFTFQMDRGLHNHPCSLWDDTRNLLTIMGSAQMGFLGLRANPISD